MWQSIEVTQDDIEKGIRFSCFKCPLALALKRQVSKAETCSVELRTAKINGIFIDLPKSVMLFIIDFDLRRSVKPFSFTIQLPVELN